MTTQPRGISGFQQSPSQPIPRYGNQSFNTAQAYSPRHIVPSSSPHQSASYFPQGHPGGQHDMYKGPGTPVAGTPPVMQPPFLNGGHRQRAPVPQVQPGARGYYYPVHQRFSGMQAQAGPPGPYQYQYPGQAQYQYMQHPQMTQQQMFSPANYTQYQQQPSQQQQLGPQVQQMMPQQPPTSQKREKRIIRIVDPNTNQDVTEDIIKGSGSRQDSLSTPPSGRSSATPPQGDVAAKFAAQVAVAAGTSKSASPLVTPPIDTPAVLIPTNQQNMLHQMPDQHIVGSPSMSIPMVQSNSPYINMPGQAPSPRPPSMSPQTAMAAQQFAQMQSVPVSHPSPLMLSASPGHSATFPQVQHGQMGMPPSIQDQIPQTGYQVTQQRFVTPHTTMRQNIPEGIYPPHPAASVHVPTAEPSPLPQPTHVQTAPITRPTVQQQQSPPAVHTGQTVPSSVAKDISHSEPAPSQPVVLVEVSTPPVAAPKPTTVDDVQSVEPAPNEKPDCQTDSVQMKTKSEGAIDNTSAAIATEAAGVDISAPQAPKAMTKTEDGKSDKPVDQVPPKPEKTEQEQVKEDTAVRLEDQDDLTVSTKNDTPLLSDDVKSTKDSDSPAIVAETDKKVDAKPEIAPSPVSKTEPAKSVIAPTVNIVPATPPVKTQPPKQKEVKKSNTSSEDVDVPEEKAKSVSSERENVEPKFVEKQERKPGMKSPEPQKQQSSNDNPGTLVRKDSSEQQQKTTVSKASDVQKVTEKAIVNGLDSSIESETSKDTKKTEEGQLAKPIKPAEAKPVADSKASNSKPETSRSSSVSSEKTSEKSRDVEETNGVGPGKSKAVSDIKYEDDQWSPLNPKGKRQYASSFLLQFQYKPTSLEKPKDLPDIDIVLHQPHKQVVAPIQAYSGADFTPPYMRQQPRRTGRQNSRDHYNRMGGRSSMSGPGQRVIQKVVSIDRDVELKTTENAWKPVKRDKTLSKVPADEVETMEVIRDVRSILNKLTPSTFTTLIQQVLALKIDTEKKLRGTIDLIFEKAIDEPNFSEAYANMCRQMTQIRVTPTEPDQSPTVAGAPTVEFRKLLLTKCQREFEKNKSDQEHLLELKKKMEENKDAELAPQLKEEYEVAESKERRRTLGNIRFIGELYKLRMLTESIMHNCIMALFKAKDDDHLESLCRLLTTIGKDLDHVKGKQRMDQYFEQISKIIQEKRTSSRVRFMLQDVRDLRLNNWVPRAIVTQGPKTISQIHQDAKQEQELLQLKLATTSAPPPTKQGGRQQNRMGSRGHGEDGWTKVQTPAKPTRYDPNKMKLKPNQFDENKVTLGPSRGYMGWKSGSAGSGLSKTGSGGYSPSGSMDKTQETGRSNTPTSMKNRFSALSQGQVSDYDSQRRQHGRQSSREGSRTGSRGSMGPPSSGGRTPRKDERSSVLEATRKITSVERGQDSRQRLSRESSPSVRQRPSTPQQQPAAQSYNTSITEEIMQQKSKNILEEFLSIVDFKEATECIEELRAPPTMNHCLVYVAHEFTLEKKREERVNIGRLMAHLLKRGRLSVEQYIKGLAELLEMGSDYEIDVPKVWEYFAEQLFPVFQDDKDSEIPMSCLAELASPLQEEDKSGIFVAEVVKALVKQATMEVFLPRWQRSNMLWSKIIGKDDEYVEKFLSKHNLSELSDSKGPSRDQSATWQASARTSRDEQYRLEKDIRQLLDNKVPNDDIFTWVEKNVKKEDLVKPPFLRALTIAVCKKALNMEDGVNVVEDRISERGLVLKKFMDGDPERELQALYSLQHLMVVLEQPANVLRKFFDVLYNEDVVSEQTFYKWEKSDDPNEQEGRGVAVASVNPFFTWLRTAELESD